MEALHLPCFADTPYAGARRCATPRGFKSSGSLVTGLFGGTNGTGSYCEVGISRSQLRVIEPPRLFGNICRRIAQPQIGLVLIGIFGDDAARAGFVKLVHHTPGQTPVMRRTSFTNHLAHGPAEKGLFWNAGNDPPDLVIEVDKVRAWQVLAWALALKNDHPIPAVNDTVKKAAPAPPG